MLHHGNQSKSSTRLHYMFQLAKAAYKQYPPAVQSTGVHQGLSPWGSQPQGGSLEPPPQVPTPCMHAGTHVHCKEVHPVTLVRSCTLTSQSLGCNSSVGMILMKLECMHIQVGVVVGGTCQQARVMSEGSAVLCQSCHPSGCCLTGPCHMMLFVRNQQ
jgi:hypothetical protein